MNEAEWASVRAEKELTGHEDVLKWFGGNKNAKEAKEVRRVSALPFAFPRVVQSVVVKTRDAPENRVYEAAIEVTWTNGACDVFASNGAVSRTKALQAACAAVMGAFW